MRYILAAIIMAICLSGCRQHQQRVVLGEPRREVVQPMSNPLEEYERMLHKTAQFEQENSRLRRRLDDAIAENSALYAQLAQEQRLRRDAELKLQNAQADIDAALASQNTIEKLQTALDHVKSQLAAAQEEVRARREELAKVVLEQQQWNQYVLERLQARN